MKLRNDFVTNSSSTSYIISNTNYSVKDIARMMYLDLVNIGTQYEGDASENLTEVCNKKLSLLEEIPDDTESYLDLAIRFSCINGSTYIYRIDTQGKEQDIRYPYGYDWSKNDKKGTTYVESDSLGTYINPILIDTTRNQFWNSLEGIPSVYHLGEDFCYLIEGLGEYLKKEFVNLDDASTVYKFLEKLREKKKKENSWWLKDNIVDLKKIYEDLLED